MCPPWCGSLPWTFVAPKLSSLSFSHLRWLFAPLCPFFVSPSFGFRSFVSCLQLCWLRWHTSTTLVLHFFLRMSSGLQGVDVHPFPTICLPSVPTYLLLVPCLLLLAFCGLFSWVFLPDYFNCLSLRCCLASWGFTSTCLLIVTYLFVYFEFDTPDNHLPCLHTFCLGVKAMTTLVSRPWRSRIFYVCTAKPWERPQHLLMRAACGIHCGDVKAALETYDLMSR